MRLNWQVDIRMAEIASETAYKGEIRLAMSQKRSGLKMFDAIVRRWKLERSHRVINSLRANCFAAQHRARGEQEQSEVMMEVSLANPFVGVFPESCISLCLTSTLLPGSQDGIERLFVTRLPVRDQEALGPRAADSLLHCMEAKLPEL